MRINRKNQKGLSLIEILVVITIFAILGIVIARSIILSLQGSQKSTGLVAVRENLDFATSIIERQLRNANSVTSACPVGGIQVNPLVYVDQNGNSSSFACVAPSGG